ncbi:MAG: NADH-quinone oxidoreductase subunit I [Thermodesulfobacteriota bacterium]
MAETDTYNQKYRIGNIPADVLKAKQIRKEINLTLWEWIYIPEILRGLLITSRHFFSNLIGFVIKPSGKKRAIPTIYYPEEKPVIPPAYRGRPVLVEAEDGSEKCVACGLCERVCPAYAIFIIGGERENGERYPVTYNLDMSLCIFCGFCEEVCPVEAIVMSSEYENLATYDRENLLYNKEKLLVPERDLETRLNYIRRIYSKCNY